MRHIHPFPARMAPEIVLERILRMSPGQTVLDPMSGSGMVLAVAARNGIRSVGVDSDPLACLISRTCSTRIDEQEVMTALGRLLSLSRTTMAGAAELPWIDSDRETSEFISYWFGESQIRQLRALSHNLVAQPFLDNVDNLNILKVALSRLIVTKEPKASLARDTAHSRPHRTSLISNFDIFEALPGSLLHVLKALEVERITINSRTILGDAREISAIEEGTIDSVVTSPPYLNAIDYMRGHKLSLVWLGYSIAELREIRTGAIGTERSSDAKMTAHFLAVSATLGLTELPARYARMLARYFEDLSAQLRETRRVLRIGGLACYVIGNSDIRGNFVANSEFLKEAAALAGLAMVSETIRKIPENSRYLPLPAKAGGSLSKRMRTEHVLEFAKAA